MSDIAMNASLTFQENQKNPSASEPFLGVASPGSIQGPELSSIHSMGSDKSSYRRYNDQEVQTDELLVPPPTPALLNTTIHLHDGRRTPAAAGAGGLERSGSNGSFGQSDQLHAHIPEPLSTVSADASRKNIVFFGETGVGKSSVINMFRDGTCRVGSEVPISSGAVGCTFSSKGYEADVDGVRYMLWDTAGLNEGVRGTVTHQQSVVNLASLLHNLGGRIHLLVYCIRGKRFRQVIKDNYELFYKRFCRSRVPIVVVVTGLENEEPDMENWWTQNNWEFVKYGLTFDGHACVTATRGKAMKEGGNIFDEEYEVSQKRVRSLISEFASETACLVSTIEHSPDQESLDTLEQHLIQEGDSIYVSVERPTASYLSSGPLTDMHPWRKGLPHRVNYTQPTFPGAFPNTGQSYAADNSRGIVSTYHPEFAGKAPPPDLGRLRSLNNVARPVLKEEARRRTELEADSRRETPPSARYFGFHS